MHPEIVLPWLNLMFDTSRISFLQGRQSRHTARHREVGKARKEGLCFEGFEMKGRFVDKQRVRAGFFKVAKLRLFSIVMFQEMEHTSTRDASFGNWHVTKSHPRNPVSPSQKTHFQELLENQCGQVCYFGNSEISFKAPRTPNIFSQIWGL